MTAGFQFHAVHLILAITLLWPGSGTCTAAAEPWSPGNSQYQVLGPSRELFAVQASSPGLVTVAQPFPPIDGPDGPSFGSPVVADPYGIPPLTSPFESNPGWTQAYEYDSFTGHVFGQPYASEWCTFSWLCPFANSGITWIQGQGDSLGFTEFERQLLFTNPLIAPFRIIPGFTTRYVSGPDSVDLPGNLTELSVEVAATYQLPEDWVLDVGIRPSLNGDFKFVNNDTFRLPGHAVASRAISPTTQAALGFVYLAREDISILPVAGLIWQPNPDVKWELVFPKPRVAVRVGGLSDNGWLYLRSELGGNSWSIERANGHRDVATYRDVRLILGYEAILPRGFAAQLESGWVFSRKLMYASDFSDFTPRDTFMIRASLSF